MYLYLLLNISAALIPFIFSFHLKLKFYAEWKWFFPANLLTAAFFIWMDVVFTRQGIWGFNADYVTGIYWLGLPIEEILFFICIPFACLFTLHALHILFPSFQIEKKFKIRLTYFLAVALFISGILFHELRYTATVFLLCSLSLLIMDLLFRKELDHFYQMFGMILIPFFIINGILTGTGIPEEVVWYNNDENLSIRILTIPIEDFFYGMALLLLNAFMMNLMKRIFIKNPKSEI